MEELWPLKKILTRYGSSDTYIRISQLFIIVITLNTNVLMNSNTSSVLSYMFGT